MIDSNWLPLLSIYLFLYNIIIWIRRLFFSYISRIVTVSYVINDTARDITFQYYFNIGLKKYCKGTYYVKIYNADCTNNFIFDGTIESIQKIKLLGDNEQLSKIGRKQVILSDQDNNPIPVDLIVLDRYKINMSQVDYPITNLHTILKLMGICCTYANIVNLRPPSKTTMLISDVDINDLYL